MDFTSRMVALLGESRRERNGAVADAMRYYGASYGLNYGVSLPTVRRLARAETADPDFARYLYLQEVRELRLAALHIAAPETLTEADLPFWATGIINSEVAEEAAFALLSRSELLPALFDRWIADSDPLLQYAALLAAARSPKPRSEWITPTVESVRRNARIAAEATPRPETAGGAAKPATAVPKNGSSGAPEQPRSPIPESDTHPPHRSSSVASTPCRHAHTPSAASLAAGSRSEVLAARMIAQGAVTLLTAIGGQNEENRQAVIRAAGSLGKLPAEDFIHEELTWRLRE